MSKVFLAVDEAETLFPEAHEFQSGLTVRTDDSSVGVGLVLRDEHGNPLAGISMNPEEAMEHASYIIRVAIQLAIRDDPIARVDSVLELIECFKRELGLPVPVGSKQGGKQCPSPHS